MSTTQLSRSRPQRRLGELTADLLREPLDASAEQVMVGGIQLDSRRIVPGDLYAALPGTRAHGAQFIAGALERGAVAVLTDQQGAELAAGANVPVLVTDDARATMADLAVRLFDDPSARLRMFGLTGTNGKTTTSFLIESGLRAAGRHVGTIGTIGFRLDGAPVQADTSTVTTPEANDLQALLDALAAAGADDVVMEVSSHALALQRVRGIGFDVVGFINLGRDHLDFHPTMEDYFEAKARLFEPGRARVAVVTVVDEYGARLADRIRSAGSPQLVTIAEQDGPWSARADIVITAHRAEPGAELVSIRGALGERTIRLNLPGDYNGRNGVLALAMLVSAGLRVDDVMPGLEQAQVPGRMQPVALSGAAPTVLVDFAHTPQAISAALEVGRQFGRTIVVVGAGGDRDRAKRPLMGRAAAAADVLIITDDNPRTEDPAAIRAQVLDGAREAHPGTPERVLLEIGDRRRAIAQALRLARSGDLVLILGKGHEQGQLVGDQVLPFDDVSVVQLAWREQHAADPREDR